MKQETPDHNMQHIIEELKKSPSIPLPINFADIVVSEALDHNLKSNWAHNLRSWWQNITKPRQIVFRPVWQLAWVLMLCVASAATSGWYVHNTQKHADPVWVRFAIKMPQAQQVALTGDFNAWETEAIQMEDPDGDGIWDVLVPLQPGIYQYMYVINGKQWVLDPVMGTTIDDGFGQQNSLLKITPPPKKRHNHVL